MFAQFHSLSQVAKPYCGEPPGDVLGDEVAAAAVIDQLVNRAEVVSLRGDS